MIRHVLAVCLLLPTYLHSRASSRLSAAATTSMDPGTSSEYVRRKKAVKVTIVFRETKLDLCRDTTMRSARSVLTNACRRGRDGCTSSISERPAEQQSGGCSTGLPARGLSRFESRRSQFSIRNW